MIATQPPANPALSEAPAAPAVAVTEQRSVSTRKKEPDPNTPPADGTHTDDKTLPKLPHERDQSVDMTDGIPSADMQQAHRDVKRGLVDTDAGLEGHNVGKPVVPTEPTQPGTPGPVEPDHR